MSLLSTIDQPTFASLKESMGDDFIDELLQTYFEETQQLLSSLQQALEAQDYPGFARSAHSIKSTSNSFGALEYGLLARELEMMGKAQNLDGAKSKVEILTTEYLHVRQALEELRHGK